MTKEKLIKLAESILNTVDSYSNLDGIDDYNQLINLVACIISEKLELGIIFTDEELGL